MSAPRLPRRKFGLGRQLNVQRHHRPPAVCFGKIAYRFDPSPTGQHRRAFSGWYLCPNPQFAVPVWQCRDCGTWDMGRPIEVSEL